MIFIKKFSLIICLLAFSICNDFCMGAPLGVNLKSYADDILGNNTYCFWTEYLLSCSNFTDLNDLKLDEAYDFSSLNLSYIELEPKEKIVFFSETKAFQKLKLTPDSTVLLKNFKGFEIFDNPFVSSGANEMTLNIADSNWDLYEMGRLINSTRCDDINKNSLFFSFLDRVQELHLYSEVQYSLNFCPAVFKNVIMVRFVLSNLGSKEGESGEFSYAPIDTSVPSANLGCSIKTYIIRNSIVSLNTSILNPDILLKTEELSVVDSTLTGVQEDLFKDNFLNLRVLDLNLINLHDVTDNKKFDRRWIKHLNNKYNETKEQFNLLLASSEENPDDEKSVAFYDENFCLFKDFPHENFVFPIIYSKPDLNCTCTLLWLLKNYENHKGPFDMSTTSTGVCIDRADFADLLAACDFETRISQCNNNPVTTTTPMTTTVPDNTTIIGNTTYCSWSMISLECVDFPQLDELGLNKNLNLDRMKFSRIRIAPKNKIVFESSSSAFRYVGFAESCEIVLENFAGFEMTANPFLWQNVKKTLVISKSNFDVYFRNGAKIDPLECNQLNNQVSVPIFENINKIVVLDDVTYSSDFCPVAFKHARLERVSLQNIANVISTDKFSFVDVDTYLPSANLDCQIEEFIINNSFIAMDTSIINPDLLLNTKRISIKGSTVTNINNNLFDKKFSYLEYLEIETFTLVELLIENKEIYPDSDNRWLAHLNHNYNETNKQLDLVLTDLYNYTRFPEETFCSLIKFPHENFVFPIITTVADLSCTCPLIWLLKNRDYYNGPNDMSTISTAKCLDDPNFDDYILGCNFTERIENCYKYTTMPESTTSVTTTKSTKKTTTAFDPSEELNRIRGSLSDYKIAAAIFIVFTIVFLGLIIFTVVFPKYFINWRKNKFEKLKEEIKFVNIN